MLFTASISFKLSQEVENITITISQKRLLQPGRLSKLTNGAWKPVSFRWLPSSQACQVAPFTFSFAGVTSLTLRLHYLLLNFYSWEPRLRCNLLAMLLDRICLYRSFSQFLCLYPHFHLSWDLLYSVVFLPRCLPEVDFEPFCYFS